MMLINETPVPNSLAPAHEAFWRLPDLPEPSETPSEPSDTIALIPLFVDAYRGISHVDGLLRAAIYSRMTCIRSTDSLEKGVQVKLYIEDILRDRFLPTLEANHVDPDEDVMWFSAPPREDTKNGIWNFLGKKTILYYDRRLSDYEWVVSWDADLFFCPRCAPIFSRIEELQKTVGYIITPYKRYRAMKPGLNILLQNAIRMSGYSLRRLLSEAGINIPPDLFVYRPIGCLLTYPAKHFHKEKYEFVDWMRQFAPIIGHDEVLATYFAYKFNIPILSLSTLLDIALNDIGYHLNMNYPSDIVHGIIPIEREVAFRKNLMV